ncbi:hypothetical protein LTR56_001094 [Elasticomyces elasticus]|nr:hypothetical protein LTR56_001094 [Elasticomyces elasticus]KAK3663495.1 hypothetical protein LTR22_005666 [Elasticomyces elasticus]KAK4927119.1 hypothetical protein LTR49_006035 [Elasticomyces elasticus]KAK5769016.1 hypothetical protein LTS12_000729 [Elasticomyces elasticus]
MSQFNEAKYLLVEILRSIPLTEDIMRRKYRLVAAAQTAASLGTNVDRRNKSLRALKLMREMNISSDESSDLRYAQLQLAVEQEFEATKDLKVVKWEGFDLRLLSRTEQRAIKCATAGDGCFKVPPPTIGGDIMVAGKLTSKERERAGQSVEALARKRNDSKQRLTEKANAVAGESWLAQTKIRHAKHHGVVSAAKAEQSMARLKRSCVQSRQRAMANAIITDPRTLSATSKPSQQIKSTRRHRLAVGKRKTVLEAIKLSRTKEQRTTIYTYKQEHRIRFADFNAPIEALLASMRYQELRAAAYKGHAGEAPSHKSLTQLLKEAEPTLAKEEQYDDEADAQEEALVNEVDEVDEDTEDEENANEELDNWLEKQRIDSMSIPQKVQQSVPSHKTITTTFASLLQSLSIDDKTGDGGEKAVEVAFSESPKRNGPALQKRPASGLATKIKDSVDVRLPFYGPASVQAVAKAKARREYLATLPGPIHDYVEGVTNIYYHPSMLPEHAPMQLDKTIKCVHEACRNWSEQYTPQQFIDFSRQHKATLDRVCRDLHWIAAFLHCGRYGWDTALWPSTLFAELGVLMPEVEGFLGKLAGYEGCEWLEPAAAVHVRYAFGRLCELARP